MTQTLRIKSRPSSDKLPSSLGDALTRAQSHPTIRKHRHEWQAAREEVSESFAALLPSLELEGSVGRQFDSFNKGSRSDSLTATARLRMNIFSASDYATIDEKRSLRRSKEYLYHNAKERIKQEATNRMASVASPHRLVCGHCAIRSKPIASLWMGCKAKKNWDKEMCWMFSMPNKSCFNRKAIWCVANATVPLYHYRLLQAVGALTPQTLAIPRAKD